MKGIRSSSRAVVLRPGMLVRVILMFALLGLSGCAEVRLRMGTETHPQDIESVLRFNQSTQGDVRRTFGPPDGIGAYVSPITGRYSTVWSYYFAEGTLKTMDDTFLFVYFDDDVYEGYLWFENTISGKGGQ